MRTKTERLRLIRDSFHSECEQIVGRMFRLRERGRQNPSKLWAVFPFIYRCDHSPVCQKEGVLDVDQIPVYI